MAYRNELGKKGEDIAYKYLVYKKYKPVDRNYRSPYGEIDLIMYDGDILVFIEVKSRTSNTFGSPAENVGLIKQSKIIKTSLCYLETLDADDVQIRYDIVEVLFNGKGRINHIENAFSNRCF